MFPLEIQKLLSRSSERSWSFRDKEKKEAALLESGGREDKQVIKRGSRRDRNGGSNIVGQAYRPGGSRYYLLPARTTFPLSSLQRE